MQPPKGFKDILPPESEIFSFIENKAREIFSLFNYHEIRIPTIEYHELFIKSTGDTSDIIQKEMYKFEDNSGRILALRPEGTPGVARAFINNSLHLSGKKTKFFYIANMFRAEKPQAGRYREFEQIGVEYLNDDSPYSDAELIFMLDSFLKSLFIKAYRIEINSIGCDICRPKYKEEIIGFLSKKELCDDCKIRLVKNPLRVLDCKIDKDNLIDLPRISLCHDCSKHYEKLKKLLSDLKVNFQENHLLVRGLDYYTRTVFEFKTNLLGSQDAIGAGGRYDKLIHSMGGPQISGSGWATGVERIVLLMQKEEINILNKRPLVFVVSQSGFEDYAFNIANKLRENNITCDLAPLGKSMKAQFRSADSNKADYVIIVGEDEVKSLLVSIKDLKRSVQYKVNFEEAVKIIKNGG